MRVGRFEDHMTPEEKYRALPTIDKDEVRNEFKHWVLALDASSLYKILDKFNIDPKSSLERLKLVQRLVAGNTHPDLVINGLWAKGIPVSEDRNEVN